MLIPVATFLMDLDEDDMADSYLEFPKYIGQQANTAGTVSVGVQDGDTVRLTATSATIAEGSALSVHGEDDTDYQNTSGFNAIAVIIMNCDNTGAAQRHVKIYSAPTTDSTSSATLLFEIGKADNSVFNANNDSYTTPPLKIQNNHFIVVENVDDSRAGTNNVDIVGSTSSGNLASTTIIERQV